LAVVLGVSALAALELGSDAVIAWAGGRRCDTGPPARLVGSVALNCRDLSVRPHTAKQSRRNPTSI